MYHITCSSVAGAHHSPANLASRVGCGCCWCGRVINVLDIFANSSTGLFTFSVNTARAFALLQVHALAVSFPRNGCRQHDHKGKLILLRMVIEASKHVYLASNRFRIILPKWMCSVLLFWSSLVLVFFVEFTSFLAFKRRSSFLECVNPLPPLDHSSRVMGRWGKAGAPLSSTSVWEDLGTFPAKSRQW